LDLKKLPGVAGADVAAADAASELVDAVGEAVVAAEAVVAVAIAGDVAAGGRRDFLNCPSVTMPRSSQFDLPSAACANCYQHPAGSIFASRKLLRREIPQLL